MERTKWIERTFTTDIPPGVIINIIERLKGTPVRLNNMLQAVSEELAEKQLNSKWSIKQHVGHLIDLEILHDARLDDYKNNESMLRPADMTNAATESAGHNSKKIKQLLKDFEKSRNDFIRRLEALSPKVQFFQSLHPRLKISMRPVDLANFIGEHDDHHLATIRQILHESGMK